MRRSTGSGLQVRVDVAPAYELVLSMGEAARGSRTLNNAAVPAQLQTRVRAFAESDCMWTHLVALAAEAPRPRDVPALLAHLEIVPAIELQRHLVGYYVTCIRALTPPDVIDRALRGNPVAIRTFLRATDDARWRAALRARLEDGPAATKGQLLDLLERWDAELFAPALAPTLRALRAVARARARRAGGRSTQALVDAFISWNYCADPGISRVLIVPSLVLGRTVHVFEHGQTQVLCCGLETPRNAGPHVPVELLTTSRALADASRLRILAVLGEGDRTAQELSDRLGLGLTTLLHHMATLRTAQLVERGGRRQRYRLARAGLAAHTAQVRSLQTRGNGAKAHRTPEWSPLLGRRGLRVVPDAKAAMLEADP